jgi:hypothetical protein
MRKPRDDAGWRAQITRICAHHGQCHHAESAAQSGRSVCILPNLLHHSA